MNRRQKHLLLLILAIGAMARGAYLLAYRSSAFPDIFFADHLYYREWALRIASGELLGTESFEQGPLYAYALALLLRLFGAGTIPVLAAQMAAGLCTVALIFACTRRIGGLRAAVVAGLLSSLYGPFVFHEGLLMKTVLEPLFIVVAVFACLRFSESHQARWMAGAGLALGLACLLREVHALYVPLVLSWSLRRAGDGDPWKRYRAAAMLCLSFIGAVLPVSARNYLVSREVVAVTTGGGEAFYLAFGPYAGPYYTPPLFIRAEPGLEHEDFRDEARLRTGRLLTRSEASRYWYSEALKAIIADPMRAARLVGLRARIIGHDLEPPDSESFAVTREQVVPLRWLLTFGCVAGLGLLGALRAFRSPGERLVLLFVGVGIIGILLTYPFSRFRLAIVPLWIILAGLGTDWLLACWGRSGNRVVAVLATAGAAIFSLLSFAAPPASADWIGATEESYRAELRRKGAHKALIPQFEREIAARPGAASLYDALASQYEETGKLHEAARTYRRAIALDPDLDSAHWRLANVLFNQGRLEAAYVEARAFVARFSASADGHLMLGVFAMKRALARSGPDRHTFTEESRAHLAEAIRLAPLDPLGHYYRGKLLALVGDPEGGLSEVNEALRLQPSLSEAVHLRALLEARLGPAGE